jgi:hypothetical protein
VVFANSPHVAQTGFSTKLRLLEPEAAGVVAPAPAAKTNVFNEDASRHRSADRSCAGYSQSPLRSQKLKQFRGRWRAAMAFDWTPEGVAWKMNAACRHPGINCSEGDAI